MQQLISDLDENEKDVLESFNCKWGEWKKKLTRGVRAMEPPNIETDIETCLKDHFKVQWKFLNEKLGERPLKEWGGQLKLTIMECHIQVLSEKIFGERLVHPLGTSRKSSDYIPLVICHTETTFELVQSYLERVKRSGQNYNSQRVTDLLTLIKDRTKVESNEYQLSDIYTVDMAVLVCGHAIPVFDKMAQAFRMKHDPTVYVDKEMKPHFEKLFLNLVNKVNKEKVDAETLCQQLKGPIEELIKDKLTPLIVRDMKGTYSWIKSKKTFVAKTLLEIGEDLQKQSHDALLHCMQFIHDPKESLQWWVEYFVKFHCDSSSPSHLSVLAKSELYLEIQLLKDKVRQCHSKHIGQWLKEFHSKALDGRIKLSLPQLNIYIKDHELSNADIFVDEVIKGLQLLYDQLCETFSKIKYSDILRERTAHEILFESIAGCTALCPFCGAQCELTTKNHPTTGAIKHSVQHRPKGLGGMLWEADNSMVLEVCTFYIASNAKFKNEHTKGTWKPIKKYSEIYPQWSIPADKSLTSSLYWKWFIGNFSHEVSVTFGADTSNIPQEWKKIKWGEVKKWLEEEYML